MQEVSPSFKIHSVAGRELEAEPYLREHGDAIASGGHVGLRTIGAGSRLPLSTAQSSKQRNQWAR
jgi:hypothetical protein